MFLLSDNIDEAERQWKVEFHRWSSYMMHWKSQFDHYSKQERCTDLWEPERREEDDGEGEGTKDTLWPIPP